MTFSSRRRFFLWDIPTPKSFTEDVKLDIIVGRRDSVL
jgi:hypothetical protein